MAAVMAKAIEHRLEVKVPGRHARKSAGVAPRKVVAVTMTEKVAAAKARTTQTYRAEGHATPATMTTTEVAAETILMAEAPVEALGEAPDVRQGRATSAGSQGRMHR